MTYPQPDQKPRTKFYLADLGKQRSALAKFVAQLPTFNTGVIDTQSGFGIVYRLQHELGRRSRRTVGRILIPKDKPDYDARIAAVDDLFAQHAKTW